MKWQDTYEPVIGLEVHAELKTDSKMFCSCVNDPFGAEKPNSYTCPVCLGMPGGLPVPNKKAIEWTLKIGLAAGCKVNEFSKFDRKHYFYPDLAKGYQISQYDLPFCYDGQLETNDGAIGITRIHLEEDTGKLLHTKIDGKEVSLVDFNRSGVPLVEIVTEPDITSGSQAKEFGKKLRELLRHLDVSDCDMEQGGMRLEANISMRKKGEKAMPAYKVEIKNINSFRFMEQAIDYELNRQAELLEKGEVPVQETRGWNANANKTFSQRGKEMAEDYRYFPEPDIPPIKLSKKHIEEIKESLPEERQKTQQYISDITGLSFVRVSGATASTASASDLHWVKESTELADREGHGAAAFFHDFENKRIEVSPEIKPSEAVKIHNKAHATEDVDSTELEKIIKTVFADNTDAVKKYQAGEQQVLGFLMGQVLRQIEQKVDPKVVRKAVQDALEA